MGSPMSLKRRTYSTEFKVKVALEALREEATLAELAHRHGVHRTLIGYWKRQAVEGLAGVFAGKAEMEAASAARNDMVERLHAKIGELLMERDDLHKAYGR